MFVANGSEVCLFETVHLTVSLGLKRLFLWQFKRASVRFPVIGMDFLRHHGLAVDTVGKCLQDATAFRKQRIAEGPALESDESSFFPNGPGSPTDTDSIPTMETLKALPNSTTVENLLSSYPSLFDLINYFKQH